LNHTAEFVIRHGYSLLFFWIFAEQGALPLPSVPLLLVCGALVRSGRMSMGLALLAGLTACLLADGVWFQLGRLKGSKILGFLCRMTLEPDSCVRKTENGFARYGVNFLLISKFVPGMNALAGPLSGSSGVSWLNFILFDTLGTLLFLGSWGAVGYLFSDQLELVGAVLGQAGFRLFLLIVVAIGIWIGWKYLLRWQFLKKLEVARITPEQLQEMMRSGEEIIVIDVRGGKVVAEELVPGSLRIPMEDLPTRHKEIPRDRDVILFCT
jgi:membrane protein DedA with SNARE-associated domain